MKNITVEMHGCWAADFEHHEYRDDHRGLSVCLSGLARAFPAIFDKTPEQVDELPQRISLTISDEHRPGADEIFVDTVSGFWKLNEPDPYGWEVILTDAAAFLANEFGVADKLLLHVSCEVLEQ